MGGVLLATGPALSALSAAAGAGPVAVQRAALALATGYNALIDGAVATEPRARSKNVTVGSARVEARL